MSNVSAADGHRHTEGVRTDICSLNAVLCGKQDISREFPRALDIGSHAGHIYQAICEKVQLTNIVPCIKCTATNESIHERSTKHV